MPFAGSGSECIAAKELGLPFVAVELNEEYVKLIRERLETHGNFNCISSEPNTDDGSQLNK